MELFDALAPAFTAGIFFTALASLSIFFIWTVYNFKELKAGQAKLEAGQRELREEFKTEITEIKQILGELSRK